MKAMLNIIEEGEDTDGRANINSYEGLPDHLKALVDSSRASAQNGSAAYAEFFKALAPEDRGFLAFNRTETGDAWHDQNKRAAAAFDGGAQ
jgi:hypothetical protein